MTMTTIEINPIWRCPCGAPIKAFDFHIAPDKITLDCRRCQRQLLTIKFGTSSGKSAA
jgi:hypothetical protein